MARLNIELFKKFIFDAEPQKRKKALESALYVNDASTLPYILKLMEYETDSEILCQIIECVGKFGKTIHNDAIKQFLYIKNEKIQEFVENALIQIRENENLAPKINQLKTLLKLNNKNEDDDIHISIGSDDLMISRKKIGEILLESKLITEEELESVLKQQQETKNFLGDLLQKNKLISEEILTHALAHQNDFTFVNPESLMFSEKILKQFPFSLLKHMKFIPFRIVDSAIYIITPDMKFNAEEFIKFCKYSPELLICGTVKFENALEFCKREFDLR